MEIILNILLNFISRRQKINHNFFLPSMLLSISLSKLCSTAGVNSINTYDYHYHFTLCYHYIFDISRSHVRIGVSFIRGSTNSVLYFDLKIS